MSLFNMAETETGSFTFGSFRTGYRSDKDDSSHSDSFRWAAYPFGNRGCRRDSVCSFLYLRTGDTLRYTLAESPDTIIRYNTLTIPKGNDYHLMLSDGSVVYLNTSSRLRYPVRFSGKTREVELLGEGYFDVKHDPDHPFIVKTKDVAVKVLGTSFNVRAYQEEEAIYTTLVEGRVEVRNQQSEVILSPSQQAVCTPEGRNIDVQTVNTDYYVGWISGRFIFNNTRLDDILTRLQQWYNFEVFYEKEELKDLPFSLNIDKHKDFSHILNALERTERVRFSIKDKTVVVKND